MVSSGLGGVGVVGSGMVVVSVQIKKQDENRLEDRRLQNHGQLEHTVYLHWKYSM